MKKIKMPQQAYIIVGDLVNVRRAQDALRGICQPNSEDYISESDLKTVMSILAKWSDAMFKRIDVESGDNES